jgi:hypothetical protein
MHHYCYSTHQNLVAFSWLLYRNKQIISCINSAHAQILIYLAQQIKIKLVWDILNNVIDITHDIWHFEIPETWTSYYIQFELIYKMRPLWRVSTLTKSNIPVILKWICVEQDSLFLSYIGHEKHFTTWIYTRVQSWHKISHLKFVKYGDL